ncbi:recombinase RecA [Vibrio splendidus]
MTIESNTTKNQKRTKIHAALAGALGQIEKQYGKGSTSSALIDNVRPCSTGSVGLDVSTGYGGFPRGHISEVFSPPGVGKTTLVLTSIAEAQRRGELCLFIDAEHALDPMYASKVGVNIDELYVVQPDSGEQVLYTILQMVQESLFGIIVVDSAAALDPEADKSVMMGDNDTRAQSLMFGKWLKNIIAPLKETETAVVFTNQIRNKLSPNGTPVIGNSEVTPGGNALKHYVSLRVDLRLTEYYRSIDSDYIGQRILAKVVKNKLGPTCEHCELDIMTGTGVDRAREWVDFGLLHHLISINRKEWWFEDVCLGHSVKDAVASLRSNVQVRKDLRQQLIPKLYPNRKF